MAGDAAERLRELVAAGEQIPYDVEEAGKRLAMPQYIPLTERFIRDNAPALQRARLVRRGLRRASSPPAWRRRTSRSWRSPCLPIPASVASWPA